MNKSGKQATCLCSPFRSTDSLNWKRSARASRRRSLEVSFFDEMFSMSRLMSFLCLHATRDSSMKSGKNTTTSPLASQRWAMKMT